MVRSLRSRALGLAVVGALAGATVIPLVSAGPADAAGVVKVQMSKGGKHIKLSDTTFKTGKVTFVLKGASGEGWTTQVIGLNHGIAFPAALKEIGGAFAGKLPLIKKMYSDINFLGGTVSVAGTVGTVEFAKPGTYYFINTPPDSNKVSNVVKLTVTGPRRHIAAPSSSSSVIATNGARWGAVTLQQSGTLVFQNKSKDYAHFVDIEPVKAGTTEDMVLASFQGPPTDGPPPFVDPTRQGAGVGIVSMGEWTTTSYHLAPGAYVVLCFMPDKKMGMPHAAMGMIKIVTVS